MFCPPSFAQSDSTSIKRDKKHFFELIHKTSFNGALRTDSGAKYIDTLRILMNRLGEAKYQCYYYVHYGNALYYANQPDSSRFYLKKAVTIAQEAMNPEMVAYTESELGKSFLFKRQLDSALYYFNKSVKIYTSADTLKIGDIAIGRLAGVYSNIGTIYLRQAKYDSAVSYYYKALHLFEKSNISYSVTVLNNLGAIYIYHKEYKKALDVYNKSLKILKETAPHRKRVMASIYTNAGTCYRALGMPDTAMIYYQNAMKIRKVVGPARSVAGLYDNIGHLKKANGDYESALQDYQKALEIRKKMKLPGGYAASYGNIAFLQAKMKQYNKAIPNFKRAIEDADSAGLVETSLVCQEGLANAYKSIGNYKKALDTYMKYTHLNDSIHTIDLQEKLELYKEKYEAEKKDRVIQQLEEEQKMAEILNEQQKIKVQNQKLISNSLAILAVLLLIIIFVAVRYFKMKRKADQEVHLRKQQQAQQKTLNLMKEFEVSTIKSFMEGQEKERSRIAGDLHDRLGSLLSTVKLHFSSLEASIPENEELQKNFEFALGLLDKSVEEVRAVSRNLTKGVLTQFGLIAAVESMAEAINSTRKIQMKVIQSGLESRLDSETEITLFRVIQELVTNIIRHAQTDEIFVQFVASDNRLNIIVEDHGVGFDTNNIKSNGIGLSNMKERIATIGGEFTIDSVPGEGTTVIIDIPFKKTDEAPE